MTARDAIGKIFPVVPEGPAQPPDKERANSLAVALSAGTQLVVSVLVWLFAGLWLDKKLGTGPWLVLLGAVVGIVSGLYLLIKELVRGQRGR